MSHATGYVRFSDGEVMLFEYNGTVDVVCTALKRTHADLERDWRTSANERVCTCGAPSEPVDMATTYGAGYSWPGKACRRCMAITGGFMPADSEEFVRTRGLPAWATSALESPIN